MLARMYENDKENQKKRWLASGNKYFLNVDRGSITVVCFNGMC